jgi:hypothetical protein
LRFAGFRRLGYGVAVDVIAPECAQIVSANRKRRSHLEENSSQFCEPVGQIA